MIVCKVSVWKLPADVARGREHLLSRNWCCEEKKSRSCRSWAAGRTPRVYSLPPWIPRSLPKCVGFANCMAAIQTAIWEQSAWGSRTSKKSPHSLQAVSEVVLGVLGIGNSGAFAFTCCELHLRPLSRAWPTRRRHDIYQFSIRRRVAVMACQIKQI